MAKRTALGTFGTGRRGISTVGWPCAGRRAGAAGTTALNLVAVRGHGGRGRPASSTPEQTVEKLAGKAHVSHPRRPADPGRTGCRASVRSPAWPPAWGSASSSARPGTRLPLQPLVGTGLITAGVLVATNGPMTVLGVTDPRTWTTTDWVSDVVPHVAYAVVVKTTMDAFDRPRHPEIAGSRGCVSASRARPPRPAPAPRGRTGCG